MRGYSSGTLAYHGTDLHTARLLAADPTRVDVSIGGGELGRGFYAGDHVALAATWARGRHASPGVLEIEIAASRYASLATLTLSWVRVVNTWNQLVRAGGTHTYLFGYDVVYGPLATYPHAGQHKFESLASEDTLKQARWSVL